MNQQAATLRDGVRAAYSDVADQPTADHPFPVGREFAISVGYPPEILDSLPAFVAEAFAGVSNVAVSADLPAGATVLDLGCGAGLDTLIAARSVGAAGRVIGMDFSRSMITRALHAATTITADNVLFVQADGESIPLGDGAVDGALVNGIFNLNLARDAIFRELGRVVRPGGVVFAAEIILREPLSDEERTETNWFA